MVIVFPARTQTLFAAVGAATAPVAPTQVPLVIQITQLPAADQFAGPATAEP